MVPSEFFGDLIRSSDIMIVTRLAAAILLGGIIGYERERAGKVAGLRTHTLVALGSCLFTIISLLLFTQVPSVNGAIGYDYHLVANIVVGIGFIGAGAIMRKDDRVCGTTTAASLWVVAAVGVAAGFGFYREALATTLLAYLVLTGLWMLEKRIQRSAYDIADHPSETTCIWSDEKSVKS